MCELCVTILDIKYVAPSKHRFKPTSRPPVHSPGIAHSNRFSTYSTGCPKTGHFCCIFLMFVCSVPFVFGSIVYNRAKVYVIIIELCNQVARL